MSRVAWPLIPADCRDRTAREVVLAILPGCVEAQIRGGRARVAVKNLELLTDSVTLLLKAFDRLAADLGAEIILPESSRSAGVSTWHAPGRDPEER